ncbi:5'-methylthioadenosine/S-adenosylhomocysteine nucleosidase [Paraburkholderia phenazinium]|nr:5'-methylthioadenosine/S-adenosylhomocysteine nucleosidase [Paraburkholderia phenazinium]
MTSPNAPSLVGKNILIAGSILESTDGALARRARDFVKALAAEVIHHGGRLVVYLGGEPVDSNGDGLTFDWLIAREVDALCPGEQIAPRLIVVTSERNRREKMTEEHRKLIAQLTMRNVCDIVPLHDATVTGGNIGDAQVDVADAMFAVGGGKGVLDRARKLAKLNIPTLASDIEVGGYSNDGEGAIGLHRQFMNDPTSLMMFTGPAAVKRVLALSLQEPVQSAKDIAAASVALIGAELVAKQDAARTDVLVLTALAVELTAAKTAFSIAPEASPRRTESGINYWRSQQRRADGTIVTCDVASFGNAGNVNAASMTSTLISELGPTLVLMVGIAAGMRDKCKLGQVVIAERVVGYEGMAVVQGGKEEARPEQYPLNPRVRQDITAYLSAPMQVKERLDNAWKLHELTMPEDVEAGPVTDTSLPELSTIASGEQLLRDTARFAQLRELHGKIEVVEMEAVGVHAACHHNSVPALVIRGISDFGDSTKDGRFHALASNAAALVAIDLIKSGLGA